jgi:acyl carrier protein
MTDEEITRDICALLSVHNKDGIVLKAETDIPAELNIDSVGVLDFIMDVEDKFDIEIPMNVAPLVILLLSLPSVSRRIE